jgi:hypothetical protein
MPLRTFVNKMNAVEISEQNPRLLIGVARSYRRRPLNLIAGAMTALVRKIGGGLGRDGLLRQGNVFKGSQRRLGENTLISNFRH